MPESTVETLRDEYMPEMPPLESGGYLVSYLLDVGPTVGGAMGAAPVTSRDLMPWCEETGIRLAPWEAAFVRRLSRAYLAESSRAEKRDRPAPWQPEQFGPVVSDAQAAIRALANL